MRNFLIILVFLLGAGQSFAQCEKTAAVCNDKLAPFISDGQFRGGILKKGDKKLYRSVFYGGKPYKLVVGNEGSSGNVRYKILDIFYRVLFDSAKHGNPSSWKLKFKNTSDFIIELSLTETSKEGCALILIGFEN